VLDWSVGPKDLVLHPREHLIMDLAGWQLPQ
jgi:hypothetical protein